jgi:hypothetical protein
VARGGGEQPARLAALEVQGQALRGEIQTRVEVQPGRGLVGAAGVEARFGPPTTGAGGGAAVEREGGGLAQHRPAKLERVDEQAVDGDRGQVARELRQAR